MDWSNSGLGEQALAWLRTAGASRYTPEVRLDPFATSMRNFDDVAPNLALIRSGQPPAVTDPIQRITDLRSAGLVSAEGDALTELGIRTYDAWLTFNVANRDIGDELARLLLMVLEGRSVADEKINRC